MANQAEELLMLSREGRFHLFEQIKGKVLGHLLDAFLEAKIRT